MDYHVTIVINSDSIEEAESGFKELRTAIEEAESRFKGLRTVSTNKDYTFETSCIKIDADDQDAINRPMRDC